MTICTFIKNGVILNSYAIYVYWLLEWYLVTEKDKMTTKKREKNQVYLIHIIKWILFESAKQNQRSQMFIKTCDSMKIESLTSNQKDFKQNENHMIHNPL